MATHIKNLIQNFIGAKKKEVEERVKIRNIVDENLDEKLKIGVELRKIHKNTLIFYASSSHFSYEFNLKKRTLLENIQKHFPYIKEIKIRVE
ncbi:MAG: DUF721 domain-containing protein [Candidatus Omnitrophota bacterium]|nr:MAG: DUF721 domain-containing protein [Candidatus Omnitrophota bacterium]